MALWVCRGCTTAYSVGAPACPHCGSTSYREQGADEMPKITVQGGASNAGEGPQVVGAQWGDDTDDATVSETGPEVVNLPEGAVVGAVSAVGVDQGEPEVGETLGGPFKPLPEVVEDEQPELVSEPDYENWTVKQLREVLADRKLQTSGLKPELVERLQAADAEASDG